MILTTGVHLGCSNSDEPHPRNYSRFVFLGNTPLTFVLPSEFGLFGGYFESSVTLHADSSESQFENDASFFNHLGNPFLPEQPFSIMVSNQMLFDTSTNDQYDVSFSNFDSIDFSHPVIWQVNGGKDAPSFSDTLLPPQRVEITFPPPNTKNVLPKQPFTIKYNVVGSDSLYIQLMVFSTDTTSDYFYQRRFSSANTGSFEVNDKLIPFPPVPSAIHISIAAKTEKIHHINGQNYLLRSGIIDNAGVRLSN